MQNFITCPKANERFSNHTPPHSCTPTYVHTVLPSWRPKFNILLPANCPPMLVLFFRQCDWGSRLFRRCDSLYIPQCDYCGHCNIFRRCDSKPQQNNSRSFLTHSLWKDISFTFALIKIFALAGRKGKRTFTKSEKLHERRIPKRIPLIPDSSPPPTISKIAVNMLVNIKLKKAFAE